MRRLRGTPAARVVYLLIVVPYVLVLVGGVGHEMTNGLTGSEVFIGLFLLIWLVKWMRTGRAVPADVVDPGRTAGRPTAWEVARQRLGALSAEYAAFECDPLAVLRRPALADVRVPSTARFVDAFAEAVALETDGPPPESHAAAFCVAVDAAERTWRAARSAADRIQVALLTPDERAGVERVIKLLTTATCSDSEAERLVAYSLARSELGRLAAGGAIRLPAPARAALDEAARAALPAGADGVEGPGRDPTHLDAFPSPSPRPPDRRHERDPSALSADVEQPRGPDAQQG